MAYKVIILYQLYMPSYFLGTFTEYPDFEFIKIVCLSKQKRVSKKAKYPLVESDI